MRADVNTVPGANPKKIMKFLREHPRVLHKYHVIVVHIGTTWLSAWSEWALYLRQVNGQISREEYDQALAKLDPPPAIGKAETFRDQYQEILSYIKAENSKAIILVSAIIPRPWDHQRRNLVRKCYNNLLQKFSDPMQKIFFIKTFKPFFGKGQILKKNLHVYTTQMVSTFQYKALQCLEVTFVRKSTRQRKVF